MSNPFIKGVIQKGNPILASDEHTTKNVAVYDGDFLSWISEKSS
jgi:hypothetical protein